MRVDRLAVRAELVVERSARRLGVVCARRRWNDRRFATFGSPERSYHWLQAYRRRADVGLFGPYGVAEARRKTGLGALLLTAALCSLAERFRWALIPAVSGAQLIASYEARTDAHVADSYDYVLRPARAVILARAAAPMRKW